MRTRNARFCSSLHCTGASSSARVLPYSARRNGSSAAVIGRSFRVSVLRAVDPSADLDRVLAGLLEQQILVERRPGPDPEHMFRHVLIQETVYDSILRRQRRLLDL